MNVFTFFRYAVVTSYVYYIYFCARFIYGFLVKSKYANFNHKAGHPKWLLLLSLR